MSRDQAKVKANQTNYLLRRRAIGVDPWAAQYKWKLSNKDKVNASKRRRRREKAEKNGRVIGHRSDGITTDALQDRLAVANARQAWVYWIKVRAPDWWMRDYYRQTGKPWNNPRIGSAEKFRIRYWIDLEFRAKEILKIQRLKTRRALYIDTNNDGSLTPTSLATLFASTKHCTYCKKAMRSVEKTLDHVTPITRGGQHALTNACVCCKTCNSSKGNRLIDEWIGSMMRRIVVGGNSSGPWRGETITGAPTADSSQSQNG